MKTSMFRLCARLGASTPAVVIAVALVALCVLSPAARATGSANPYDQLSATLAPLASVFNPKSENRALVATLSLESMTGLAAGAEGAGGRLELLLEPPHHALLRGTLGGREIAVGRAGQTLWMEPASLSALAGELPPLPKKKKKRRGLDPIALPFPPEQIALLPVLFVMKDAGKDAAGRQILEGRLMPELAKGIASKHPEARVNEWVGRLFYNGNRLERIELARPGWQIAIRVERLEYRPSLPAETWQPTSPDIARFTGPQARLWLNRIGQIINRQAEKLSR